MAHVIENECVACARCDVACPEHCIFEGEDLFIIDAERCTDCGDCVKVCPVGCITPPPDAPARR
jgi:NAD-dependent dihydropyrimidine dehydrogenase PreA subunit